MTLPKPWITHEQVDNDLDHHAPDAVVAAIHDAVRQAHKALAHRMIELLPEGPTKTTAYNKIREAMMWANAAVACQQDPIWQREVAELGVSGEPGQPYFPRLVLESPPERPEDALRRYAGWVREVLEAAGANMPPDSPPVTEEDVIRAAVAQLNEYGELRRGMDAEEEAKAARHKVLTEEAAQLVEGGWNLIANAGWDAHRGTVDHEKSPGWHEAALRWREQYFAWLGEAPAEGGGLAPAGTFEQLPILSTEE